MSNADYEKLLADHPEWSRSVRAAIAQLAESGENVLPAVVRQLPVPGPGERRSPQLSTSQPISLDVARKTRAERVRAAQEPWITKPEIAAPFKVTERTIERWMKLGMPFNKPFEGGAVRFRLSECKAWRQAQSQTSADRAEPAPNHTERLPTLDVPTALAGEAPPPEAPNAPIVEPMRTAALVEPWVDLAAVAAHLASTPEHIRDLTRRNDMRRIPHRRDGRRLLFKLSRVDRWLDTTGCF